MDIIRKTEVASVLLSPNLPLWARFLAAVGLYVSLRKVASVLKVIWIYFLRPRKSFAKHKGNWAVVTGASFGIGYGFSVELAKRGMNVALLARSGDKLKEIATELETKYSVKTKVIVVDFGSTDRKLYDQIEKELEGLTVTMLVNNVGINTFYPKFFHEHTPEEIDSISHVNITSPNHMTRIVLPQMRQRKFGTIINLSSASALEGQPTPLFPIYAATKAYNHKFSTSLSHEVERDGVEVIAVNPYFVTSKMSRMRRTNLLLCSETTLANETLNKLGYNMRSVIPWINHFLQFIATTKIPYGKEISVKGAFKIRKLALRKMAEKEQQGAKKDN